MAERIMMTPAELDEASTFITTRQEAITQDIIALKNKVVDVAARWEGAAQEAFIGQFEDIIVPFFDETLPLVLGGLAGQLSGSAKAMREADELLAQALVATEE